MKIKICTKCKKEKTEEKFRLTTKRGKEYRRAECVECERIYDNLYHKKRYNENKKELCEISNNFYKKNKEKINKIRRKKYNDNPIKYMLNNAKYRAKKKGLEFNLEIKDIIIPTHCPVLGLELKINDGKPVDCSPSLDRINPKKGYIKGNVEIISHRANSVKNNGTIDEHRKIADWMEEKFKKV